MFDYKGRVVVITGASSGLGRQMAVAFAKQGADLAVLARRLEKLESLTKEIKKLGVRCLPIKCDVTNVAEIEEAGRLVKKEFGKVDVLVNCAGSAKNNGVLNMTDEEWRFTMATDLDSVFYVTRTFANIMKKKNYGRIINIASMYGLVGNTAIDTVAYHSSKGGVINFTRAVAAELAKYNITCNAICPGYFATELTIDTLKTEAFTNYMKATVPLGRYGNEGELNAGAIFLGSKEASYVTGVILPIDGGYTAV
ncbi:MAG: SDR family oxidoreductase [Clostridia bacterium]|nr:SDR family oxidoreductase [Clostridia bacterium]